MKPVKTRSGRLLTAVGSLPLLTMDRMEEISRIFDADPRIATVSLVGSTTNPGVVIRQSGPGGAVTVIALDLTDLLGAVDPQDPQSVEAWVQAATERGLRHNWLLSDHRDVLSAEAVSTSVVDEQELSDPSGAAAHYISRRSINATAITVNVDVTWLGPHETGAQVLTTAAISALANQPNIESITLTGLAELPPYAAHVTDNPKVILQPMDQVPEQADIVWYPNQIDQRSNISQARELGRRVVATYLDLIAYDIPRYHGSTDAWLAYRSLQRKIALSVDGITTISVDVARQLLAEVPRLSAKRVKPLPLGLDHVTAEQVPVQPDADVFAIKKSLTTKPFIVVLGNDFQHKNRDFAIAVWEKVLESGTPCDLVLVGLHVKSSSSRDRETELIRKHVDLRGSVYTAEHVTSASRAWLLANASVALYPTSAEGFGFVPYEAAAMGTPATFTNFGPLAEIAQLTDIPTTWSIQSYANDIIELLNNPEARDKRVSELQRAISAHTWNGFGQGLAEFFTHIIDLPPVLTSTVADGGRDTAALSAVLSSKSWRALEKARNLKSKIKP
jgi:glycosyltransferase involved in cell wall biosynthesis